MRISVIIPIVDHDEPGADVVEAFDECIVVDGGVLNGAPNRVRDRGGIVLSSSRGRALQMNSGARAATGDVLLFLHADTRLPADAAERIREAVGRGAPGGCFRTEFDGEHFWLSVGDWWRNWRANMLRDFYGDQSIFIRRDVFERLGGYRELRRMEDYDLCRRMKRHGRPAFIASPAFTSSRRFQAQGMVRTWLRHQWIKLTHFFTPR